MPAAPLPFSKPQLSAVREKKETNRLLIKSSSSTERETPQLRTPSSQRCSSLYFLASSKSLETLACTCPIKARSETAQNVLVGAAGTCCNRNGFSLRSFPPRGGIAGPGRRKLVPGQSVTAGGRRDDLT